MKKNQIKIPETARELLIDAIIELAGDEFETIPDLISLAKANEIQLINQLISIANYYKEETNNID